MWALSLTLALEFAVGLESCSETIAQAVGPHLRKMRHASKARFRLIEVRLEVGFMS